MIILRLHLIIALLTVLLFSSCEKESSTSPDRVVIGIASDIESLNPLYAFSQSEGNISMILYPGLVQHKWNNEEGEVVTTPMLAERWEWSRDSSSIMLYLRDDVYWSDSVQFTAGDVMFSFDLYSDPDVQSRYYGMYKSFYTKNDLSIDIEKTFEMISPFQVKVNYLPGSTPDLFSIDYPILPKHIFKNVSRENFGTESAGIKPVVSGAYQLERWDKEQVIVLKANEKSFLYDDDLIPEIIFKVVPDYTSRITQLKQGEIDIMEDIKPGDVEELIKDDKLITAPVKGIEYEYVGWSNIDPVQFNENGRIVPHNLFGSAQVRKALTYAINRQEILEDYLFNHGQIASGPVAPIFKHAYNTEIKPYTYSPSKAKEILLSNGWKDTDNDGVLEKDDLEFSFTLYIPAGNPRRNFTATMIKNNLKAVGIDVNIASLEMGVFIDDMFARKLDAWLASWSVPIPITLKIYWHSDLSTAALNSPGYRNKTIDNLLMELEGRAGDHRRNEIYKEIQEIMYEDQPVSFLYWIDNTIAYNSKIKNIYINPVGFIEHCWQWRIE